MMSDKRVKTSSHSSAPQKATKSHPPEFPATSSYIHSKVIHRESEIKQYLATISLPRLKARQKEINDLWCAAGLDPKLANISSYLELENKWLLAVIEEKKHAEWVARRDAKHARLAAESPEERKARVAKENAAQARRLAGLEKKKDWEAKLRIIEKHCQMALEAGEEWTVQDARDLMRSLDAGKKRNGL